MLKGNDVYYTVGDSSGYEYIITTVLRHLQKEPT